MVSSNKYVWVVAYINKEFMEVAGEELRKYGYKNIEAYIPTVKVLRKQFKGKQMFEFIPMLFNYGFFKMPYEYACNAEMLLELRHRISCIYAWVKDPTRMMHDSKPGLNAKNKTFNKAIPRAAVATDEEISEMIKTSRNMGIFTQDDLKQFKTGDYIKLEGYPFEGMPAEILKINYKKKEVTIRLMIEAVVQSMTVSFDNVFYSIYKNYSEKSREQSTEELIQQYGNNAIDHITFKHGLE